MVEERLRAFGVGIQGLGNAFICIYTYGGLGEGRTETNSEESACCSGGPFEIPEKNA